MAETSKAPAVGETRLRWLKARTRTANPETGRRRWEKSRAALFLSQRRHAGCTKEACGLRDRMGDLRGQRGSHRRQLDSADSHQKFISKYTLNFRCWPIPTQDCRHFRVRMQPGKSMARRVSFLIGKDGKIVTSRTNPRADVHLTEMQEAIAKLPKS